MTLRQHLVVGTVQTPGCQIDLIESLIFNKSINDNEDVDIVDVGVEVDVDDNEVVDGVFDLA